MPPEAPRHVHLSPRLLPQETPWVWVGAGCREKQEGWEMRRVAAAAGRSSGRCWEGFTHVSVLGLCRAARPQHLACDPVPQLPSLLVSHHSCSSPGLSGGMQPPTAGSSCTVTGLGSGGSGSTWELPVILSSWVELTVGFGKTCFVGNTSGSCWSQGALGCWREHCGPLWCQELCAVLPAPWLWPCCAVLGARPPRAMARLGLNPHPQPRAALQAVDA